MHTSDVPIAGIARGLQRSELAIKARLVRLGLISRAEVPELDELDERRKGKAKPRF